MKHTMIIIMILAAAGVALQAESGSLASERFLSAAVRDAAGPDWIDGYARELARLAGDGRYGRTALERAAEFCRAAEFPADHRRAAALTFAAIRETDYRLRSGVPAAEIHALVAGEWRRSLEADGPLPAKKKKNDSEEKLKKALGLEAAPDQSLPADKDKLDKTIDEKVKDKKDKLKS